ncbi:hypothetical protein [Nocardia sp. NPDC005366]|uniref:hypothetical protein n=1 Tax=Nocardia sp. NPDC005366 TaxID=3156878 RepID=UPI00339E0ECC
MPKSVSEYADDTTFERYVLSRATPFFPSSNGGVEILLDDTGTLGINFIVTVADSTTCAAGQHLTAQDVYPLLFGAAWKVLDLLMELRLHEDGVQPERQGEYTITQKVGRANSGNLGPANPLKPSVWRIVMGVYAATAELRHSLVHSGIRVDLNTANLIAINAAGTLDRPMTVAEQRAFCRSAAGIAQAVIDQKQTRRDDKRLKWLLDQLAAHHRKPVFNVALHRSVHSCNRPTLYTERRPRDRT